MGLRRALLISGLLSLPALAALPVLPGGAASRPAQSSADWHSVGGPTTSVADCTVPGGSHYRPAQPTARECAFVKTAQASDAVLSAAQVESSATPIRQPAAMVGVPWNPELLPAPNTAAVRMGKREQGSSIPTPVSGDIPIARVSCEWSHFAADDPLVFPDQFGRSHLHMFWGNTTANASTKDFRSDRSTCAGGAANSSGYWIAALIDTLDGRPLVPETIFNYYKGGYLGVRPSDFRPWPAGLRMLAGSPMNTRPRPFWDGNYRWSCAGVPGQHGSIPPGCTPGGFLIFEIAFPQCWDGVNLDSPDHKSHMRYADRGCPRSHPVAMPEVTYVVNFRIPMTGAATLRLSSDQPGAPAGTSAHADWWDGWDAQTKQHLIANCHNQNRDCGTNLLGGGLALY